MKRLTTSTFFLLKKSGAKNYYFLKKKKYKPYFIKNFKKANMAPSCVTQNTNAQRII
jgi:hypothetical protein